MSIGSLAPLWWIHRCSSDRATAVVMLLGLVHRNAMVFGWWFSLARTRLRKVAAGAFALLTVSVALTTAR